MVATRVPPAANDPAVPTLVIPGRGLSAGAGASWIAEGWRLFLQAPLMWIVFTVLITILMVVMGILPILGNIIWLVLSPVIFAGLVVGCWALESGGELEIEHLTAGFQRHARGLLIVGAIYCGATVGILLIFGLFVGLTLIPALFVDPESALTALTSMGLMVLVGTLVCTALWVLVAAASWFAPALVVMHGMAPVEAMKQSFFACFRNFIAFLVYGVLMVLLAIVAMIPLLLGLLVWVPLLFTSTYRAYRQIFTEG